RNLAPGRSRYLMESWRYLSPRRCSTVQMPAQLSSLRDEAVAAVAVRFPSYEFRMVERFHCVNGRIVVEHPDQAFSTWPARPHAPSRRSSASLPSLTS